MSSTATLRKRTALEDAHESYRTAEAAEALAVRASVEADEHGLLGADSLADAAWAATAVTNRARVAFVEAGEALLGGRTRSYSRSADAYAEALEELATGAYTLTEVRTHVRSRLAR